MDKNAREKDMLYEWSVKNIGSYDFQKTDKNRESYFKKREGNDGQYIREYAVQTLPEIMEELDVMWGADEIMGQIKKTVGVASLKNKPDKILVKEDMAGGKKEVKNKLPEYIYNF